MNDSTSPSALGNPPPAPPGSRGPVSTSLPGEPPVPEASEVDVVRDSAGAIVAEARYLGPGTAIPPGPLEAPPSNIGTPPHQESAPHIEHRLAALGIAIDAPLTSRNSIRESFRDAVDDVFLAAGLSAVTWPTATGESGERIDPSSGEIEPRPLATVFPAQAQAVWELLHVKDTGELGYHDLEVALDAIFGIATVGVPVGEIVLEAPGETGAPGDSDD